MIKSHRVFTHQVKSFWNLYRQQQLRHVSALYITGDKAKENYVTLQPYMDFKQTLAQKEELELSITRRKTKLNLNDVVQKYEAFKVISDQIIQLEQQREDVADKLKRLNEPKGTATEEAEALKSHGKALRQKLKDLKETFYPIEDDFVNAFLDLPNLLHAFCPSDNREKVLYRSRLPCPTQGEAHLKREDLIRFLGNTRYYLMEEAAEFDVTSTHALTNYFVDEGKFLQMSNPDFVRCVLLEANGTPLNLYHQVKDDSLPTQFNAAYLAGGGTFESFLGAVAKLCVYPSVVPLRFVAGGRSYQKVAEFTTEIDASPDAEVEETVSAISNPATANLYTATQTNAVQTFVAADSISAANEEMDRILDLAVNFYKELNIHFRIVYADASALTSAESLRAVLEVYSPAEQRYVTVGQVSHYTDYVSKRILFTMRQEKDYNFLHLVGGPVLYTSRLIAALIENGVPLAECKLLGDRTIDTSNTLKPSTNVGSDEFKKIFE